jgi:hypothetical protein
MTATNVIIDNIIDYSSQLTSIASSLGSIATSLSTLATSVQQIGGYVDGLESIGTNLVTSVNRLSTATEHIVTSVNRLSTATELYATTASMTYATSPGRDVSSTYFAVAENTPAPELTIRATWTGVTNVITLITTATKIVNGLRIEGQNIDAGTLVQSVIGRSVTLTQNTLGSSSGYYRFYIN